VDILTELTACESWRPLGEAMLDYQRGDKMAQFLVKSSVEADRTVPVSAFYRENALLPMIETHALRHCRGKVLDAGAGSGPHSLVLQKKGYDVTAIDISPQAVEVMQARGVKKAFCSDLFAYEGKFDTVLMMMNGIGIAASLDGLGILLNHLKNLLAHGGQILFDSTDLSYVTERDRQLASIHTNKQDYYGTIHYQLFYKNLLGEQYDWLFVDKRSLMQIASAAGLKFELLKEQQEHYLGRLISA
jgi:2-polyprenyl-3-methyl-5-hydroxy-6-metoxy-1,4-benzoquinol methylase